MARSELINWNRQTVIIL